MKDLSWLRHPLALVAFTLFSGLFSLSLYSSWRRNQASGGQVATLEQQVAQEAQRVESLQNQVEVANTPAVQEKMIRDQLLMQKEGERVMQIPEITGQTENLRQPEPSPTAWEQWQEVLW